MTRAFFAALFLLVCAGCAGPAVRPPPPDPATQMSALEMRIAVIVDDRRLALDPKAHPLMIDPELTDIARQRSAAMAAKNSFVTDSTDPHVSATLLMAEDAKFQGLLGENVAAQHYAKVIGVDVDSFARRFVEIWLASAAHKQNLCFEEYNRTGVGAAVNGDTVYVTQLFATDLGLGPHEDSAAPAMPPGSAQPAKNPQKKADLQGNMTEKTGP